MLYPLFYIMTYLHNILRVPDANDSRGLIISNMKVSFDDYVVGQLRSYDTLQMIMCANLLYINIIHSVKVLQQASFIAPPP